MVGGHALDYDLMGIRGVVDGNGDYVYPDDYQPWSSPGLYDTTTARTVQHRPRIPRSDDRGEGCGPGVSEGVVTRLAPVPDTRYGDGIRPYRME